MERRRILFLFLIFLFLLVPSVVMAAEKPIQILIDGKVVLSDAPPIMTNTSRVIVPVRVISENLGYYVTYDSKKKEVNIVSGQDRIRFVLNQATLWKNGTKIALDVAPISKNGRSFLPIRAISENFGAHVKWDASTQSVAIDTKVDTVVPPSETGNEQNGQEQTTDKPTDTKEEPSPVDETTNDETNQKPDQENQNDPSQLEEIAPSNELQTIVQDGTSLIIETKETEFTHKLIELNQPNRLVIDLEGMILSPNLKSPEIAENELFSAVRYSQFQLNPDQVRIVVDLKKKVDYSIEKRDNLLILQMKPKVFKVVIDAGHGGKDPGTSGVSGTREKDFNLAVALLVNTLYQNNPEIQVIMTRDSDTYPTLDERVELANSLGADLFISIHANAMPGKPDVSGTETYYTHEESRFFAQLIHPYLVEATGFNDRGIRTAGFRVIKYTTMPAVLLESGYLSNSGDEAALFTPETQQRIAQAIFKAINEYFGIKEA
ncbi:MAG: N-acetylmuramoyl-L-alanine amidase [Tepidibacillus sp.]